MNNELGSCPKLDGTNPCSTIYHLRGKIGATHKKLQIWKDCYWNQLWSSLSKWNEGHFGVIMVSGGRTLKASSVEFTYAPFIILCFCLWPEIKAVRYIMVKSTAQTLVNGVSVSFFLKLTQTHSIKFLNAEERMRARSPRYNQVYAEYDSRT